MKIDLDPTYGGVVRLRKRRPINGNDRPALGRKERRPDSQFANYLELMYDGRKKMAEQTGKQEWTDVTIHGPGTRVTGVKAANVEPRPWLTKFPECQVLNHYNIVHVGVQMPVAPSRVVRTKQTTTYFMACVEGRGRVLIDGRWRVCPKGYACLLPAYTLNAYEALPGEYWELCWVCYQRPAGQRPIADTTSPMMMKFEAQPVRSAILGLMHECGSAGEPTLMHKWVELIHGYVQRFVQPGAKTDQLRLLWERVASDLDDDWTLTKLAKEAGYSNEHLRRLCLRQLGRSPMRQVMHLRMRRAAELMVTTEQTIEAISKGVGYHSPFVFSNAFTKWIGWRPSEYRRRRPGY